MYPQSSPVTRPFFFRLDFLLTDRLSENFSSSQPSEKENKTRKLPRFLTDILPRFVSARDLTCIKNVGRPGLITQVALMRPLLTTITIVLRVSGIVPLDRRYYLSFTESHWF